jgi:TetR/AcrR family transcriptional regulator
MQAMKPQTRDAEATRARILKSARQLFISHGFAAVSMRQLAEACAVNKSLIHHHFGNKEQLWEAVKAQMLDDYVEQQKALLQSDKPVDVGLLEDSVRGYFEFLRDNPGVVRLFAWTHLEEDQSCGQSDRELVALGAGRVAEAQHAGIVRADVNPTHVVTIFLNTCTHWFEAHTHHQEWSGIGTNEEFLDDFLKVFLDGLKPPQ